MHETLTIRTVDRHCVRLVSLAGRVEPPDVPRVGDALNRALADAPGTVVVCDLAGLEPPGDETLLTLFPGTLWRAGGWPHRSLHLAAAAPELAGSLAALRMHRFLPVHDSVPQALAAAEDDVARGQRELTLPPEPRDLHDVRLAVRDLWPRAVPCGRDEAVLVTNELASNAVQHVGLPFTVSLRLAARHLLVAVTDRTRQGPAVRPAGAEETGGRGLQLVGALSREWGVRLVHPAGKTVWASLATRSTPVPRGRSPLTV